MRLPRLAIENIQFTIIVFVVLLILGLNSFFSMPRSEDPPVDGGGCSIIVVYPGANPYDMESLIAEPIEDAINEVDHIKKIKSSLSEGLAIIGVKFDNEANFKDTYDDITEKLSSVRKDLPEDLYDYYSFKWESTDTKILLMAMISESSSYRRMEKLSKELKRKLEKVRGIKRVDIEAYPEQIISVDLDLESMAHRNISFDEVLKAIESSNLNIPGGNIEIQDASFSVQTSGLYKSIEDIKNTIVGNHEGIVTYLWQVAKIKQTYEDENYLGRFDGKRAVFVSATQKKGYNIFKIFDQIDEQVSDFKNDLDSNVKLEYVLDQSVGVDHRINQFLLNLLEGIVLVGVVIFLSIGIRSSIVIMITIPLSIIIGLFLLDISDNGMQQISIGGLVLALGLLVDNGIVVVENVQRMFRQGLSPREAAIQGASQVGWPVFSSTVTTVFAFIPILMLGGVTGDFIRSLPLTVIFVMIASLFIALSLAPLLTSKLIRRDKEKKSFFRRKLDLIIEGPYNSTLNFALKRKSLVLSVALVLFVGALFLFAFGLRKSFFPKAEKPEFLVQVKTPKGSSLGYTNEVCQFVEKVIDSIPSVKNYTTSVGHGFPKVYYNQGILSYNEALGQIFVELDKYEEDEFESVIKGLREKLKWIPGARIEVQEFQQGAPVDAPITLRVVGDNIKTLREISSDIENMLLATAGTINVNNQLSKNRTDLKIEIDKDKALMLGVPLSIIDYAIRTAVTGNVISKFRDENGKEYDILVRQDIDSLYLPSDLSSIWVKSLSGKMISLNQMARVNFEEAPAILTRYNQERCAAILSDVRGGFSANEINQKIVKQLESYSWPEGYSLIVEGDTEQIKESFGSMGFASIIALIAIFAILVLQFRSLLQPLIIYSAIPLAIVGSFVALLITNNDFSFTAFIGLTSLIGIVINNSILLVDYSNRLIREQGKSIHEAVIESGKTRLTPIVLTTLTTIGGMLPLTLTGGQIWAPLGWTIIGGLAFSTFLTLIIVPVLYLIFTKE
ncbi:MAG: efflux RND transporter permease subunit [Bacteroidales bacterium]